MIGRRLEDNCKPESLTPGDYAKINDIWYLKPPRGPRGRFVNMDEITEHPNGTITIETLIDGPHWCGRLIDGKWSSLDWRAIRRLREQKDLDEFLALNLMGWEKVNRQWMDGDTPAVEPQFSRSESESVRVVNKVRDLGYASFGVTRDEYGIYTATFRNDDESYSHKADTIAHAICLAAREITNKKIEYAKHFQVGVEEVGEDTENVMGQEGSGFIEEGE